MNNWFTSCFDELLKIAEARVSDDGVILTPAEKRKQMVQFAGLGGTLVPAMTSASTKMMTGKWLPKGIPARRFWPAAAATGLFWGGALPSIQHAIARGNIQKSRQRQLAEHELRSLAPGIQSVPLEQRVTSPTTSLTEV